MNQETKALFIQGGNIGVPWEDYKSSIKSIFIFEGAEVIGERAFKGLSEVEKISISSTANKIASNAFTNCKKIEADRNLYE
mgnify:CR=1 FL=1